MGYREYALKGVVDMRDYDRENKRKYKKRRYIIKTRGIVVLILLFAIILVLLFMGYKFLNNKYFNTSKNTKTREGLVTDQKITEKSSEIDIGKGAKADESKINKDINLLANKNESVVVPLYKQIYKHDGIKTAYITFDDGPTSEEMPKILNVLDKYNVKVTFFILGKLAVENKEILKRAIEDGQAIGSHGYSHDYKKIYASLDNFKDDFEQADIAFKKALGEEFDTKIYRFPGGSFESYKNPFKEFIISKGDTFIDWNALNGDAEGENLSVNVLFERAKATIGEKEHVVILMHDSQSKKNTVEALPLIIEYLKAKGYIFKPLI